MSNDTVIGILTARDILLLEANGADPHTTTVELSMTGGPISVSPNTPVEEVIALMVTRGIGSVLVVDDQELLGIFTSVDAVRMLFEHATGDTPVWSAPGGDVAPPAPDL